MNFRLFFGGLVGLVFLHVESVGQSAALRDSLIKYVGSQQLDKAIPFARARAEAFAIEKGQSSREYAAALITWADLLVKTGEFTSSKPLILRGLDIWQKAVQNNNPNLATPFTTLGLYYMAVAQFDDAAKAFQTSLNWRLKAQPTDSGLVAVGYENLGNVYQQSGQYFEAFVHLQKALQMKKRLYGEVHLQVAYAHNNIANLFGALGQYAESERAYRQSMTIIEKLSGQYTADYAFMLNNLGSLKRRKGEFSQALKYNSQALEIKSKMLPTNHSDILAAWTSIGATLYDQKRLYEAETYFEKTHRALLEKNETESQDLDEAEYNLGCVWWKTGQLERAETYFLQALAKRAKRYQAFHPKMAELHYHLAMLYHQAGKSEEAKQHLNNLSRAQIEQAKRYFPFLTLAEKELLAKEMGEQREAFQSLWFEQVLKSPRLASELLNHQLATKGMVLNSGKAMVKKLKTNPDTLLQSQLSTWQLLRERLAKIKMGTLVVDDSTALELEKHTELLEQKLALTLGGQSGNAQSTHWKTIQKQLKRQQALVEILRLKKWGISQWVADSSHPSFQRLAEWAQTDSVLYVALLLTSTSQYPTMVVLPNGNAMENRWYENYRIRTRKGLTDDSSYRVYFEAIRNQLPKRVNEVILSPDGVFNLLNVQTLKNNATGKYLIEEMRIRQVNTSLDLVWQKGANRMGGQSILFGDPAYNEPLSNVAGIDGQMKSGFGTRWIGTQKNQQFKALPGTLAEVSQIGDMLKQSGWQVSRFVKEEAGENVLKQIKRPSILHIATHGYFESSGETQTNAMFASGLLLRGANRTLNGEIPSPMEEDGILTAYEAMDLDLVNTDLVVLSACETGLGKVKNGEGVYGLQRGFLLAGAKCLVMSLWNVDDEATQNLMEQFYKHLLGKRKANQTMQEHLHEAMRTAQLEMMKKFEKPYFWGAFVVVGE